MSYVTQTEQVGEASVTLSFESYEDFLDFKKKQSEQEALDVSKSVDPLPMLYKLLNSAAGRGDIGTIDTASKAIQRLNNFN